MLCALQEWDSRLRVLMIIFHLPLDLDCAEAESLFNHFHCYEGRGRL